MKILCYSAKLASGLKADENPDLAKRLAIVSSKISGARATLRLIDDIPMLQYTLEYGLGKKVSNSSKQCQNQILILQYANRMNFIYRTLIKNYFAMATFFFGYRSLTQRFR